MRSVRIILAIESAILGGSLSLIRDGHEITNFCGAFERPRAEELLFDIDQMLTSTGIDRQDIDLIAVSAGPGSFTGIRVGLATALGLAAGLAVPLARISAMYAIAAARDHEGVVNVAIPMGRNAACIQSLKVADQISVETVTQPRSVPLSQLAEEVEATGEALTLIHPALSETMLSGPSFEIIEANIARKIGIYGNRIPNSTAEPIFVSKADQ